MGTQQDGSAARRELDREHQAEVLGPLDLTRRRFQHVRFVGTQVGFKQGRKGDVEVTFSIPYQFRDKVPAILDSAGIPLSIDCVPWRRDARHDEHGDGGDGEA